MHFQTVVDGFINLLRDNTAFSLPVAIISFYIIAQIRNPLWVIISLLVSFVSTLTKMLQQNEIAKVAYAEFRTAVDIVGFFALFTLFAELIIFLFSEKKRKEGFSLNSLVIITLSICTLKGMPNRIEAANWEYLHWYFGLWIAVFCVFIFIVYRRSKK